MKVLIADKLSPKALENLKKLGLEVRSESDLKAEDLPEAVKDAEILVVRSTKVSEKAINKASNLSLIIRAGAGVNTIALDAASAKGIHVSNCPGKNTHAVAELAIGLLIAADRRISSASNDLKNRKWLKKEYGKAKGLKGRTLGIIGLGDIGKAVAERAKGLEMKVIGWSRSLTPEKAEALEIGYCSSPAELAAKSDAVTIHLSYSPETKHLINASFLGAMKDGTILVNTSRGEIVDTEALKNAIKTRKLRVGLDVFENEPAGGEADFPDAEIAELAVCTPHIGASTDQASEATAEEVVNIVKHYMETGKPLNGVNIRLKSTGKNNLVVRHYNKVGVLAGILDKLREEGINIEEMENTIFEGGLAASCTLKLDDAPSQKLVEEIGKNSVIIKVTLT